MFDNLNDEDKKDNAFIEPKKIRPEINPNVISINEPNTIRNTKVWIQQNRFSEIELDELDTYKRILNDFSYIIKRIAYFSSNESYELKELKCLWTYKKGVRILYIGYIRTKTI